MPQLNADIDAAGHHQLRAHAHRQRGALRGQPGGRAQAATDGAGDRPFEHRRAHAAGPAAVAPQVAGHRQQARGHRPHRCADQDRRADRPGRRHQRGHRRPARGHDHRDHDDEDEDHQHHRQHPFPRWCLLSRGDIGLAGDLALDAVLALVQVLLQIAVHLGQRRLGAGQGGVGRTLHAVGQLRQRGAAAAAALHHLPGEAGALVGKVVVAGNGPHRRGKAAAHGAGLVVVGLAHRGQR